MLDVATRWTGRVLAGLLLGLACFAGQPGRARAEIRALSLYEKCGRAPLVLWGEVTDGDDRFASLRILEVLKGPLPEPSMGPGGAVRIVYRLDSFLRKPWQDRIRFATGERVMLFARRFTREDGEETAPDLFTLMWGAEGKMLLPPEGEEAHVGTARALVAILAESDLDRQAVLLMEATGSANPMLAEAALEELRRQGLAGIEMISRLIPQFSSEREMRRVLAMRLLAQIVSDASAAGREVPERESLSDRVRGLAALDPSAPFRREAVETLAGLGGEGNVAFLRRIAKEDPDQAVRYAAERALLSLAPGAASGKAR